MKVIKTCIVTKEGLLCSVVVVFNCRDVQVLKRCCCCVVGKAAYCI